MKSIICARCGKEEEKTGHFQKYCAACQKIVKREQATASERRRRAKLGETYLEYERNRNKNPKRRQQHVDSAKRSYDKKRSDPALYADYLHRNNQAYMRYIYGPAWMEVFIRDKGECVICGSSERLGIHHKDGKGSTIAKEQRNNSIDNLILICQSCHMKIHAPFKERKNVKGSKNSYSPPNTDSDGRND